jgi:hypothetical protein
LPKPRRWRSFKPNRDSKRAFKESDMSLTAAEPVVKGGHSASVRIELHADGRILRPSHTASDYLIFREPQTIQSTAARLVITIDGVPQQAALRILPQQMPSERILVEILQAAD